MNGTRTAAGETIPPDDPERALSIARPETDQSLPHIGLVGDTYTILLGGEQTAGRFTLIDMHVPPGGGPPHTATTSRRRSMSSKVRSRSPSVESDRRSSQARR
jgi:hypothetical protein